MPRPPKSRPVIPVRLLLAGALVLFAAVVVTALLVATDTALSVWQRLRDAPAPLAWSLGIVFASLLAWTGWLAFRLWRGPSAPRARGAPTREQVEEQARRLAQRADVAFARGELEELDARAAAGDVHVALFGDVSAGKTSLLRALGGDAALEVDVRGGTTREVAHARCTLPSGRALVLADVPGLNEAGGAERAERARGEATRAHALVFVCDGDVTRTQARELERMLAFEKPAVIALNKLDRYGPSEIAALKSRLRERYGSVAAVVGVVAGGSEELIRREVDGSERRIVRERPPETAALLHALDALSAPGAVALEPARRAAVLDALSRRLDETEAELRATDSAAIVTKYTKRAIVGALAAVAPGTDLLIQGALATAMLRELTQLHGVGLRELDLDAFVQRAGSTLRTATSVTLAIAGNALKAFPGIGTIGGGALHAVAYGLIFDSLGRAVAETLAERAVLDETALERFEQKLREPGEGRLGGVLRIAAGALRERDTG